MRDKVMSVAAAIALLGAVACPVGANVTGQWDFQSGNLDATVGNALEYLDGPGGATAAGTVFGTAAGLGLPAVAGNANAGVMGFPAASSTMGYVARHGAAANAGGAYVNQYTLILDLLYPASSDGQWRGIYQTSATNTNDGDFFVRGDGGIGISGSYQGDVTPDTWHRVAVSVDLTTKTMAKYIDGAQVGVQTLSASTGGVDQRWALYPAGGSPDYMLLFTDEDGETAPGFVTSIQFSDAALSANDIAALGGPSAYGIGLTIPEPSILALLGVGSLALIARRRRA